MELDIIKTNTTWNDAAGSINNNFLKIKQAITALEVGGGGLDEDQLADYLLTNGYVTDTQLAQRLASYALKSDWESLSKALQEVSNKVSTIEGNYATKSYVDTENKKQSYFKELGSTGGVDIPTGGGSAGGTGGGSTTGGSPVGAMRLRVVNKVIYVESKSDIGGAPVKFARALRKRRTNTTYDGYVTSHAWRVYGGQGQDAREPITRLTGYFALMKHPYGMREEWYDASYPYRYKVIVGTAKEGYVDMDALTLVKAFARIKNGKYVLHTGHGSSVSAKVKMAVIIDGTFLPFRLSLNDNGNLQSYGLSPL